MTEQPILTDQEWSIILDLLDTERRNLPSEIHHTMTPGLHEDLQERKRLIEDLAQRLRSRAVH